MPEKISSLEQQAHATKLLYYRQDARSVFLLLVTLVLIIVPMLEAPPSELVFPWLVLSALFCFNACIINHNHIHHPTFRHAILNELFSHLLGLAKGHTSTGVVVAHNLNHHRYHGAEEDWIRTSLAGDGPGMFRLFRYIFRASRTMAHERNRQTAPKLTTRQLRQLHRERISLWGFMMLVLWLDWEQALVFVFLPWGLGMMMLTGVNLLQHDGCRPDDRYRNSRNFTSRLGNWFFFNNGFHTAHHLQPQMHWSRLRGFHTCNLSSRVPASLNERSILSYLLRHYLLALRPPREMP